MSGWKKLFREHILARYSGQGISIYETRSDKETYKKELLHYVLECPQNNLTHIYKLKAVCTEKEWDDYREQVRDIYISYLNHESERVSDRRRYRELMKYLKKIQRYPGGKEKASEIAKNWRAVYYRRKAMMDEMLKAGF